jgi:hypothetical protein
VLARDERGGQLMGQLALSNAYAGRSAPRDDPDADAGAEALRMAPELSAAQGQDLFVYRAPRMTLKRGERATFPLWRVGVPLRHLYTYDLSLAREPNTGARAERAAPESPLRLARNEVWHQVEIPNGTETPWTTGSVLLLRGDLPLGQDTLAYTSRGSRVLVPVTVAVDVRGSYAESEIQRRPNSVLIGTHHYTSVTKRVEVTVTNRRAERADVRVALSTGGRVTTASGGGAIVHDTFRAEDWPGGGHSVNNHSDVTWDAVLEPGQTVTLTCELDLLLY